MAIPVAKYAQKFVYAIESSGVRKESATDKNSERIPTMIEPTRP